MSVERTNADIEVSRRSASVRSLESNSSRTRVGGRDAVLSVLAIFAVMFKTPIYVFWIAGINFYFECRTFFAETVNLSYVCRFVDFRCQFIPREFFHSMPPRVAAAVCVSLWFKCSTLRYICQGKNKRFFDCSNVQLRSV